MDKEPIRTPHHICMQSMKQQTAIIGRSLRNAASRNFKEAARRENVSRRGNLNDLKCN